eukprot:GHVP01067120.1.p1 GENE.GHVP01067120.1~~GHVP01067120.1.p1  ORF type:complete len:1309 (-),score=262.54 GHVP01067120.1:1678-5550(-)
MQLENEIKKTRSFEVIRESVLNKDFKTDYKVVECIEERQYQQYYKVRNLIDSEIYLVNRYSLDNNEDVEKYFDKACSLCSIPAHPGILRCYHTWIEESENKYFLYLQYQSFMSNDNNHSDLTSFPLLDKITPLNIFHQCVQTLSYLHSLETYHGSISPKGIFLYEDDFGLQVKLGNFDLISKSQDLDQWEKYKNDEKRLLNRKKSFNTDFRMSGDWTLVFADRNHVTDDKASDVYALGVLLVFLWEQFQENSIRNFIPRIWSVRKAIEKKIAEKKLVEAESKMLESEEDAKEAHQATIRTMNEILSNLAGENIADLSDFPEEISNILYIALSPFPKNRKLDSILTLCNKTWPPSFSRSSYLEFLEKLSVHTSKASQIVAKVLASKFLKFGLDATDLAFQNLNDIDSQQGEDAAFEPTDFEDVETNNEFENDSDKEIDRFENSDNEYEDISDIASVKNTKNTESELFRIFREYRNHKSESEHMAKNLDYVQCVEFVTPEAVNATLVLFRDAAKSIDAKLFSIPPFQGCFGPLDRSIQNIAFTSDNVVHHLIAISELEKGCLYSSDFCSHVLAHLKYYQEELVPKKKKKRKDQVVTDDENFEDYSQHTDDQNYISCSESRFMYCVLPIIETISRDEDLTIPHREYFLEGNKSDIDVTEPFDLAVVPLYRQKTVAVFYQVANLDYLEPESSEDEYEDCDESSSDQKLDETEGDSDAMCNQMTTMHTLHTVMPLESPDQEVEDLLVPDLPPLPFDERPEITPFSHYLEMPFYALRLLDSVFNWKKRNFDTIFHEADIMDLLPDSETSEPEATQREKIPDHEIHEFLLVWSIPGIYILCQNTLISFAQETKLKTETKFSMSKDDLGIFYPSKVQKAISLEMVYDEFTATSHCCRNMPRRSSSCPARTRGFHLKQSNPGRLYLHAIKEFDGNQSQIPICFDILRRLVFDFKEYVAVEAKEKDPGRYQKLENVVLFLDSFEGFQNQVFKLFAETRCKFASELIPNIYCRSDILGDRGRPTISFRVEHVTGNGHVVAAGGPCVSNIDLPVATKSDDVDESNEIFPVPRGPYGFRLEPAVDTTLPLYDLMLLLDLTYIFYQTKKFLDQQTVSKTLKKYIDEMQLKKEAEQILPTTKSVNETTERGILNSNSRWHPIMKHPGLRNSIVILRSLEFPEYLHTALSWKLQYAMERNQVFVDTKMFLCEESVPNLLSKVEASSRGLVIGLQVSDMLDPIERDSRELNFEFSEEAWSSFTYKIYLEPFLIPKVCYNLENAIAHMSLVIGYYEDSSTPRIRRISG